MWIVLKFIVGLAMILSGAHFLVKGASAVAKRAGLSPLIIGLTVVAYGTSAPEFAVSFRASLLGDNAIAVGNVVGSNIFNILFILGISAIIKPIVVSSRLVRFDVPVMILTSAILFLFGLNGQINVIEGFVLFLGMIFYTIWLYVFYRGRNPSIHTTYPTGSALLNYLFIFCGLILLVVGADLMVKSAIIISKYAGLSELMIGLTIVAIGTSLPETATSVMAMIKNERDIAVGNIVGSNIFNILAILGFSSIFGTGAMTVDMNALHFDIPIMILVSALCLPILYSQYIISRFEGTVFLFSFCIYIIVLYYKTYLKIDMILWNNPFLVGITCFILFYFFVSIYLNWRKR